MLFAAHEVLYWFWVFRFYITIQSNQSNCKSIKRNCAAGCQHRFYKCMYAWINSSHCCTIGTSARPNLAPTRFTTSVRTFALWWHSKGKYISHFIAETSIVETASPKRWRRNGGAKLSHSAKILPAPTPTRSREFLNCPDINPQLSAVKLNTYVPEPTQTNTSVAVLPDCLAISKQLSLVSSD